MAADPAKSKYFSANKLPSKTKGKSGKEPPNKRTCSELSDTSMEELNLILSDLDEIKIAMKNTVTKSDLTDVVKSIVKEMLDQYKKDTEDRFESVEKDYKERCGKLEDKIDGLCLEVEHLREVLAQRDAAIRNLTASLDGVTRIAESAHQKSNYNEQYSRKNNIKIYGMTESRDEDTTSAVCKILKDCAKVDLTKDEILAAHRLPSKVEGATRPVILKVKNSDIKSRIMKQRSTVKYPQTRGYDSPMM
ncbi:hypothetical protein FSP39_023420 [Pinctada imbricata]|uniref:Uncharacterized protein n=1 Tax=Pinctada imbricata TaxID=66713 RepID=A0AA89BZB3_PINIB|nr:hypothetical protein FSP39_023420 [Pinctada imbricata]